MDRVQSKRKIEILVQTFQCEKELFAHQIKATDREIDELVYGLTEEEIMLIEGKEK